ncbi:hypothetical protein [Wenzhouxiangella marina]|uniref:Uncharacterized protein n=1 Tax=Wenzhouxiangella marina TaxID=1579979 RepID=A0A0K0Y024_9GAMM|nr:hypothetical protein [Wenzhouxiangella marina]AKS43265.1 hypothetical protein WM2015_2908 [Wenzhouxiangella marina]MBB6087048.1 pilus assembly protein TadC [Wenzhouxiangella marina]
MIRTLRWVGGLLILFGLLLAGSWFIEPLRELWPLIFDLPLPIRIGLVVAAIGLIVVMATILQERRRSDPDSTAEHLGGDE